MTPNQPDSVWMDKELNYLRKIVKDVPYIFEKATKPEPREFVFPLATLFKAPTREIGLGMKGTYADALHEHGIAGIELGFEDPDSKFMLDLVDAIGCTPDTHSSTQGALWDITYPHGGVAGANGETAHSVSHSLGQFAWHTDGSYEPVPQRYLGFHIMRPDRQGGGVFRVLRADDLISLLSPSAAEILSNTEFDLKVPAEFYKGVDSNKGKLLQVDRRTGRAFVRFRRDILLDPPSQDPAANRAVEELVSLLDHPDGVGEYMPEYVFKENTVLLVDNARYLHSRTDIKDPKRWLWRVRFQGSPGGKKGESLPK
ncbi:Taurine catabolism dioxygenase TauD/TfdA [Lasallia pustulata]|uniref:Taurine catabolism dioxygenase TauD/TfdA n=1 Tax=Lasallia pustulata TaxID=136370 RepID=A0A1W5D357_9LECA|nr:Taurine catabolism dioxygenase TauD/TfdA [Lasallia pustulata]